MAAVYAQPSYSITATPSGSAAKPYCSISLKSAVASLRHPNAMLAILTSKLLHIQKASPSIVRQDPRNSPLWYGSINSSPFNTAAKTQPRAIRNRKGSVKGDP